MKLSYAYIYTHTHTNTHTHTPTHTHTHSNILVAGTPWTLRGFIKWANMGDPIAGNFYQAEYDSSVDELWRTFDKFYEKEKNL